MLESLESLVAVMVVVAAAPIVVAFLPGRVPQVVLLIAGGVVIGPEIADLADPDDIELFSNLGLGFLFLLAGYELDPALLRERAGQARDRSPGASRSCSRSSPSGRSSSPAS